MLWLLIGLSLPAAVGGELPEEKPAEFEISGYGFLGNRQLKRMLKSADPKRWQRSSIDARQIEDAALLMRSQILRDGYLRPVILAHLELENGENQTIVWDEAIEDPLPREWRARKVEFEIKEGELYFYEDLEINGLTQLPEERARAFFVETGILFHPKRTRIYTPQRLKRGVSSLVETLRRMGYQSASVTVNQTNIDHQTGQVEAGLTVSEGLRSVVRSVREEVYFSGTNTPPDETALTHPNQPYSLLWEQDYAQRLKRQFYRRGYPDPQVEMRPVGREEAGGQIRLDLEARIRPGRRVRVGAVRFQGQERTSLSMMERRVPLRAGDLLDRIQAEEGRNRLARLGIFESIQLRYEDSDAPEPKGPMRDVVYEVKEGKYIQVYLRAGYGSYEMLRGGIELELNNLWGRAHFARLRALQSFKSSSVDFTYTMPELFGEDIDFFLNADALRREEVSFTREEFGGGAGIHRRFKTWPSDLTIRYDYQVLNADDLELDIADGRKEANVGALITEFFRDRRDNPIYPRSGYKFLANLELASSYLGGNVNYQRMEVTGAWHQRLDAGRWLHLGATHGVIFTVDSAKQDLPFPRRFFPGGENSIRGFQEGEASPRDATGRLVGAETHLTTNLEFEQALTPAWSLVFFFDTSGFARRIQQYPMSEFLMSAGGGIRYKSVIGPLRLEYGHNLNPRDEDPSGTLHFSLGFPF